jgi:hypothetical protein
VGCGSKQKKSRFCFPKNFCVNCSETKFFQEAFDFPNRFKIAKELYYELKRTGQIEALVNYHKLPPEIKERLDQMIVIVGRPVTNWSWPVTNWSWPANWSWSANWSSLAKRVIAGQRFSHHNNND